MKKRMLAIAMATAMVLSMAVNAFAAEDGSAAGDGIVKTIQLDGATFTLTADTIEDGAEITVTASGMDEEWNAWSITIHPVKDNQEYFSLVLEDGQTDFYTREGVMPVLRENQEAFNMEPNTSRTFTLHIPEEYKGWTIDARINGKLPGTYSTDVDPLILVEGEAPEQPVQTVFPDVPETAWYHRYVSIATASGQIKGTSEGLFLPNQNMTVAEALVFATRVDLEAKGKEDPGNGSPWYSTYVDYCVENGIIAEDRFSEADMTRFVTRFEVVEILDKVAGESVTQPINEVPDGFIPDLNEGDPYGDIVYKWYRAGLFTGYGDHSFGGSDTFSRAQAATILCRLSNMVEHEVIK